VLELSAGKNEAERGSFSLLAGVAGLWNEINLLAGNLNISCCYLCWNYLLEKGFWAAITHGETQTAQNKACGYNL